MNHSQRLSEKPLTPWFIATNEGKILTAHCDCAAGLGETCSHVASLLWVVGYGIEKRDSLTVTEKSVYWVLPPGIKTVPYAPISKIKFIRKKRKVISDASTAEGSNKSSKLFTDVAPNDDEQKRFLQTLSMIPNAKPAILSLVEPHCVSYVPASVAPELPRPLHELFKKEYLSLSYGELLQLPSNITVTDAEAAAVESQTRDQANSRIWFRLRAGRITASKFKAACHTDPTNPSLSLTLSICHPSPCGFFISTRFSFLGASPDSIVECTCCGKRICEVKAI